MDRAKANRIPKHFTAPNGTARHSTARCCILCNLSTLPSQPRSGTRPGLATMRVDNISSEQTGEGRTLSQNLARTRSNNDRNEVQVCLQRIVNAIADNVQIKPFSELAANLTRVVAPTSQSHYDASMSTDCESHVRLMYQFHSHMIVPKASSTTNAC